MPLPRNEATVQAIATFCARPSHAVLLIGPTGVGKGSVARDIAANLVPSALAGSVLAIDEPTIGIEHVRDITQFLRLKSTGKQVINRVIIIEHAEHMTVEAQNALLKLLEEPPADTVMVLTAGSAALLLPTIVSRVQTLSVGQATKDELLAYFGAEGYAPDTISKAFNMSGGLPGLMHSILSAETDHPMLVAAQSARQVLQASTFERLCMVDAMSKQRELSIDLCDMLGHMAALSLQNPQLSAAAEKRWRRILLLAHKATEDLRQFAQTKLVLTKLFLEF